MKSANSIFQYKSSDMDMYHSTRLLFFYILFRLSSFFVFCERVVESLEV